MSAAMSARERCHLRAHVHARMIILALPPDGDARATFRAAMTGAGCSVDAMLKAPAAMRGQMAACLFCVSAPDLVAAMALAWATDPIGIARAGKGEGAHFRTLLRAAIRGPVGAWDEARNPT